VQLSTLANGLLPFSTLVSEKESVPNLYSSLRGLPRAIGQIRAAERSDQECGISNKIVEESNGMYGCDGQKRAKERKRHLLLDALGLPTNASVTPAAVSEYVVSCRTQRISPSQCIASLVARHPDSYTISLHSQTRSKYVTVKR
jgi:hypothetical protein